MIGVYILHLAFLMACFAVFLFIRNELVYRYRIRLINEISERNHSDISNFDYGYQWRWREYETVSYEDMLFKFWKSFDSFYSKELREC
jgi:hypothetical protein